MSKLRRHYDPAFKVEVVQMSYQRSSIKELSNELGLNPDLIYRWRKEHERDPQKSFPGNGKQKLSPEEEEIARLQKENRELKLEREILKKAVSIFSKSDGKHFNS